MSQSKPTTDGAVAPKKKRIFTEEQKRQRCERELQRYYANREQIMARRKKRRQEDPVLKANHNARNKRWKQLNPDKDKQTIKNWAQSHRESLNRAKRNWRQRNPEKTAAGNLQILCGPHNLAKGAQDDINFAQRNGLLFFK